MPRTVVITGGSKGIGAAIARVFHADGADLMIASRVDSGLARELGPRATFRAFDARRPEEHHALVDAAVSMTGRLDVYVNCAGVSAWRAVDGVDEHFWDEMLDTNLKSAFFGSQAAAARLGPGGCIINVSSLAGKRGSANNAVYCASKFGVNGVTQALAKELGPRGIRVNAVCPVYVETDGLREALADAGSPAGGADVGAYLRQFAAANSALGSLPTAEQVAAVILFLTSPAASAMTGQCINVDCGVLPQ